MKECLRQNCQRGERTAEGRGGKLKYQSHRKARTLFLCCPFIDFFITRLTEPVFVTLLTKGHPRQIFKINHRMMLVQMVKIKYQQAQRLASVTSQWHAPSQKSRKLVSCTKLLSNL